MAAKPCYRVCLVGSGNWGSAIARIVGENVKAFDEFDETVSMWVYEEMIEGRKLSEIINTEHENVKYLKGYKIPENVVAVPDVLEAVKGAHILVFVMPHQFVKGVCEKIKGGLEPGVFAVSLIKGVDMSQKGLTLTSNVIKETLGGVDCSVLMGANVASEVAAKYFCESTLGCTNLEHGEILRKLFSRTYFRVAVCADAQTVELCGALKNIVGIGAGICDGLGYGSNTKAAVIRIGLKEMMNVSRELVGGGLESTFLESCGVADLVTTCYAGRNRKVAEAFVKTGKTFPELEKEMLNGQKLQGHTSAAELHELLKEHGLIEKYPLFTAIYRICYEGLPPKKLLANIQITVFDYVVKAPSDTLGQWDVVNVWQRNDLQSSTPSCNSIFSISSIDQTASFFHSSILGWAFRHYMSSSSCLCVISVQSLEICLLGWRVEKEICKNLYFQDPLFKTRAQDLTKYCLRHGIFVLSVRELWHQLRETHPKWPTAFVLEIGGGLNMLEYYQEPPTFSRISEISSNIPVEIYGQSSMKDDSGQSKAIGSRFQYG